MTTGEKLQQEFSAAIAAVLGDYLDKEYEDGDICKADIIAIASKVAFYMDLK